MDAISPGDEGGFVCPTCNQSYSRAEYLRRHQRKHTETRPFPCASCSKTFARSDVLLRHRRRVHPHEAAEEEANKAPLRSTAPKKPARRRNRAVPRPYPAPSQSKSIDPSRSPPSDSDIDDPETPPETHIFAYAVHANGLSQSQGVVADTSGLTQLAELAWSHNSGLPIDLLNGSSNPLEDYSTSNALNEVADHIDNTPEAAQAAVGPRFPASPYSTALADVMQGIGSLPSPATMSDLEAGSGEWALSGPEPNRAACGAPLTQFGAWYAFPPLIAEGSSSNSSEKDTSIPNSSSFDEMTDKFSALDSAAHQEILKLIQVGDWSALRAKDIDIFNTEYAMIDSESRLRHSLSGVGAGNPLHKFYIPPGLFSGCYTVPHWLLPPLQRLSVFASRTFQHIMCHLGIVHEPTFRLADAHAWLAFAICTAAGHTPYKTRRATIEHEPWDAVQSVVRTEKTGMFVKLFARAGAKLPVAETFCGIQALLIYNAQAFLSDNPSDRVLGELHLTTIAKLARRSGVFEPDAEWTKPGVTLSADPEYDWRRWARLEGYRRTIWLVYVLDTQASVEAGAVPLVSTGGVRNLPLPAPPTIWGASSASNWAALISHPSAIIFSLDEAMQKLFDQRPTFSLTSGAQEAPSPLEILPIGPFARLVIVITLLRGLVDYAEGKDRGGYVVRRWIMGVRGNHPNDVLSSESNLFHDEVMAAFGMALTRWKNGWDSDALCCQDNWHSSKTSGTNPPVGDGDTNPVTLFNEDALPFWWMAQILLNHINGTSMYLGGISPTELSFVPSMNTSMSMDHEDAINRLVGVDLASVFITSKTLANPWALL